MTNNPDALSSLLAWGCHRPTGSQHYSNGQWPAGWEFASTTSSRWEINIRRALHFRVKRLVACRLACCQLGARIRFADNFNLFLIWKSDQNRSKLNNVFRLCPAACGCAWAKADGMHSWADMWGYVRQLQMGSHAKFAQLGHCLHSNEPCMQMREMEAGVQMRTFSLLSASTQAQWWLVLCPLSRVTSIPSASSCVAAAADLETRAMNRRGGQRGRQRTRVEAGVTHDVSGQQFPGFERVDVNSSGRRW
jgi:hypothetical protein